MAESVRLRVMFGDAGLLKRSQQRRGLQRCLLQLRPDLATIADLAAHLHQIFGLHRSCPHGIIISMDDFVLPPFETTSILKDDDMIMINKNGVAFKDTVKFCVNQYQEQVLQSRDLAHSNKKLAIMDQIIDPIVGSEGVEDEMVLYNGSAVRMETPQNEKMNARCKRKRSTELQSSDNTLAIKDSHGNSVAEEEDISLHGKIKHKGATSNELVNANCKKKHTNKFQASVTMTSKNSHGNSQGDDEGLGLPNVKKPQEESPQCEMSSTKRKKTHSHSHQGSKSGAPIETPSEITNVLKKIHSNKREASDGTLTVEDSQGNSQRDEHDEGLLGITAHKEATSNEMMNSKHKRKRLNTFQDSNTLTSKNSHGDSQGDDENLVLPYEKKSQKESPECEMTNTKLKKRHSHRHQGLNNTLAIANSQGDVVDEGDIILPNRSEASTEIPSKMTNMFKRIHSNKQGESVNEFKGIHDGNASMNGAIGYEWKMKSRNARRKKAKTLFYRAHGLKKKLVEIQNPESNNQEEPSDYGNADQNTDVNIDIVPVIVRPGHIRFEYYDERSVRKDDPVMKSRNVRRKKAKKLFYRAHGLKKKMSDNKKVDHFSQNPSLPISHNLVEIQNPESNNQEEPSDYGNTDQNTDVNIGIVPVIVRPGHIRFESSDERSVRKDDPVDTFQLNGITSKRKGQKWGMEKSYNNWNNDTFNLLSCGESDAKGAEVIEVSNEKAAIEEAESHKDSIAEKVEPVIECDENPLSEEPEPRKQLINYESFLPLSHPPEEGDLLIYRVVELSSSWCPELSPFRVGRVSDYDPCSSKIILLPLPEYPLISEETPDEGQESASLYEEDGTLKIDFSSLVDVRLFKSPESEETTPNFPIEETTPNFAIEETTPNFPIEKTTPNIPTEETIPNFPIEKTTPHIPIEETAPDFPSEETQNDAPVNIQESEACSDQTENEQHVGDGWEAIKLALDEKKAQLEKQNKFDKKRDSGRSAETGPWSYKALRRNALGPTLAVLRSSSGH